MNNQTVTAQTAHLLAAAGFPQPAPAPGQWWNIGSEFVFVSESRTKYFTVVRYFPGTRPLADEYFDLQDFAGLVYLPTVGDILRHELAEGYGVSRQYDTTESGFSWVCAPMEWSMPDMVSAMHETSEHEAAALAYLKLHLQKQG
jgi:hypothetical protein